MISYKKKYCNFLKVDINFKDTSYNILNIETCPHTSNRHNNENNNNKCNSAYETHQNLICADSLRKICYQFLCTL